MRNYNPVFFQNIFFVEKYIFLKSVKQISKISKNKFTDF